MYTILHNPNDAVSRGFVATYGMGYTVLDWYGPDQAAYSGPHPSAFPSVTDGVNIVRDPDSMAAAIAALEAMEPVPQSVTPRQARLVLLQAGHLDAVETMLALPENRAAQITWEYALEINRDDPLITAIGGALGLTEAEIDALFVTAKSI